MINRKSFHKDNFTQITSKSSYWNSKLVRKLTCSTLSLEHSNLIFHLFKETRTLYFKRNDSLNQTQLSSLPPTITSITTPPFWHSSPYMTSLLGGFKWHSSSLWLYLWTKDSVFTAILQIDKSWLFVCVCCVVKRLELGVFTGYVCVSLCLSLWKYWISIR